jgi:transcriptional regulator with XRE-family HTH domain
MAKHKGNPLDTGYAERRQVIAGRKLVGFTQKQLAVLADVSTSTVADYERGARHTDYFAIQRMKYALGCLGVRFLNFDNGTFGIGLKPAFRPGAREEAQRGLGELLASKDRRTKGALKKILIEI